MDPIQKKKIITWTESKSVNIQMFSFLIYITTKLITILAHQHRIYHFLSKRKIVLAKNQKVSPVSLNSQPDTRDKIYKIVRKQIIVRM